MAALPPDTRLFVPPPRPGAAAQVAALRAEGRREDAALVEAMASTPQAVWLTGGSPAEVRAAVAAVVAAAAGRGEVPVLVAYDLPGRDAGLYSAGGAADAGAYAAWIDAFATGLGEARAVVILEPDALGLLADEACTEQLAGAVERLARQPGALVYLDAAHGAWLEPELAAERLLAAGVRGARGFAVNVSNFRPTGECVAYGRRVGAAIGAATPFVVDTSRNGAGAWDGPEAWCNPPGRGLGPRPTADTGEPLLDALLWVKVPGESDGACTRGGDSALDPVRGAVDPPAGAWFPELALELAHNARPPLR